uniref:Peptidase M50 domain-containing protein n=2 Tax=Glycine max TaxID=3847 RepID=A0A0R0GJU4_SOYBN
MLVMLLVILLCKLIEEDMNNYSAFVKTPTIQSSEAFDHFLCHKGKGYYGLIGNGSQDDDVELIHFPVAPLHRQIEKMLGQYMVSFQLEAPHAPNGTMNLSLAAPSSFRGNLLVPLSRCTSCLELDLRIQHSEGFRHLRPRWSSFKLIRNPRRRVIACSVTEPHNGSDEKEKEADKNGETLPLEDSSEQSIPPPVDAEQINEFSDENKGQSDVQNMDDSNEVASGSPLPGVKPQKLDEAIKIPKETIEILKNQVFGFDTFFVTSQDPYEGGVLFKGNLRGQAAKSYDKISKRLKDKFGDEYKLFLLVNPEDNMPVAVVVPRTTLQPETTAVPEWFAAGSFGLVTVFTLLLRNVPSLQSDLLSTFDNLNLLKDGLPGALVTALILGVHELGHFLAAKDTGVKLGVPYFVPSWQIGSFGAITRIRNIVPNREDLLKVAAAGPIAGYALGLLLLLLGFILPPSDGIGVVVDASVFHESFLAGGIAKLLLGNVLKEGTAISINPLVIWAWAGLLINAINSIPAGELDGGRISFALWGRKASLRFTGVSIALLGVSSLLNDVAFYWVVLIFFLQRGPIAPLSEEITDPGEKYVAIGVTVLLLGLLVCLPYPFPFTEETLTSF